MGKSNTEHNRTMGGANNAESSEAEIFVERVRAAFSQTPVAVAVTVVNAALMASVLLLTEPAERVFIWLSVALVIAAVRLTLWLQFRSVGSNGARSIRWSLASKWGAFGAGLAWGVGSVFLLPDQEIYQLFWVFLIGGMCAGAASLHFAHLPTVLYFIAPASLPLAVHFVLDGGQRQVAAAIMILVFVLALTETSRRASRNFGKMVRLRLVLEQRTHDLDITNAKLRKEITEHHAAEESLRQAQKMEAVGQLTGAIAHDFNNLLTAIIVSLELLRTSTPESDAKAIGWLRTASEAAERGRALTQRLLAFGRRQPLKPEVVRIQTLVEGMGGLLSSSLGPGIHVIKQFADALPPVEADVNQLELALLNLVVNARDAMPNGGELIIAAKASETRIADENGDGASSGTYVVLSVTDTGEGMDKDTLARAVEPFFTTKAGEKGTGLGLSMVHGFAAQSGGQFLLQSTKGIGTTAELWLPSAGPSAPPIASDTQPFVRRQPTRGGTVLVVDDDPLVLASTSGILEDIGYSPVRAGSGHAALQIAQTQQIDLVVTDYVMPGLTGLQLADELHKSEPLLPILLVSGFLEVESNQMRRLQWLPKPFGRQALADAIDRCLAAR
ncbi:MAG TPA: response regulator [Acetobacteraceae bacterium]|nr:response regulator [Acetobacteraceae bacterium]